MYILMNQKDIIKIFATSLLLSRKVSKKLKEKSLQYIREKVFHNEFVTYDEHKKLRELVVKVAEDVKNIGKK